MWNKTEWGKYSWNHWWSLFPKNGKTSDATKEMCENPSEWTRVDLEKSIVSTVLYVQHRYNEEIF